MVTKSGNQYRAEKTMKENNIKKECVKCGSKVDLCIHHKNKNRNNNSLENLEYICRSCHSKIHNSKGYLSKTSIQISKKFKDFLDTQTIHKSESYEDIIKRLLRAKNINKETKQEIGSDFEKSL